MVPEPVPRIRIFDNANPYHGCRPDTDPYKLDGSVTLFSRTGGWMDGLVVRNSQHQRHCQLFPRLRHWQSCQHCPVYSKVFISQSGFLIHFFELLKIRIKENAKDICHRINWKIVGPLKLVMVCIETIFLLPLLLAVVLVSTSLWAGGFSIQYFVPILGGVLEEEHPYKFSDISSN